MPTNSLMIGPPQTMLQNVVYALPSVSVFVVALTAAIQTSIEGTVWTTTNSPVLTGAFVRCTTGNATITLRKNGVG